MNSKLEEIPDAHVSFGGKRKAAMKELAALFFADFFKSLQVNKEEFRFDVELWKGCEEEKIKHFEKKYPQCYIIVIEKVKRPKS